QYVIRSEGADGLAGSVLVAVLHPKRVTEQADDRQDNKVGEQQSRQDSYRSRRLLSNAKQFIFYSPLQGGGGFAPIHVIVDFRHSFPILLDRCCLLFADIQDP